MRRQHPLLSPTGLVITGLLSVALFLILWRTGGQIFSPGKLSAVSKDPGSLGGVSSHAEIKACSACHLPLEVTQDQLCMACHTTIQDQISFGGLHARLENASQCYACHTEHKGPDLDLLDAAILHFDHGVTAFSLLRHQVDFNAGLIVCEDCHTNEMYAPEPDACATCHAKSDPEFVQLHKMEFGLGCLDCHDGVDRMIDFDHAATSFALVGKHIQVSCAECHAEPPFSGTQADCAGCHQEPALHRDLFELNCAACHSAAGWTPASLEGTDFEHQSATGFSLAKHTLDYQGQAITCTSCHRSNLGSPGTQTCETCHVANDQTFMSDHLDTFGSACLDCHDGVDKMSGFHHDDFFILDGQHSVIECTACHENQGFAGTPNQCSACHIEPAIHAGAFGLNCQNCHSTTAWAPATLTSHTFPLDHGGEGIISCLTCHPSTYIEYTCEACHAPAEMREEHDKEDIFDIAGRCEECHRTGLKEEDGTTGDD